MMSTRLISCLSRNSRKLLLFQRRAPIRQNVARGLSVSQTKDNKLEIKSDKFCKESFIPHTCVENKSDVPFLVKALDVGEPYPEDTTEYDLIENGYLQVTPGEEGILEHSYAEILHKINLVVFKENGEDGKCKKYAVKSFYPNKRIIIKTV